MGKKKEHLSNLTRNEVTNLVELLLEKNRLEDATNVVIMLKDYKMPVIRTLGYLINRLSMAGEMDLMKRISEYLTEVNVSLCYMHFVRQLDNIFIRFPSRKGYTSWLQLQLFLQ